MDLSKITRVLVVNRDGGRDYESWDFNGVILSVQDDGTTLKVFPTINKEIENAGYPENLDEIRMYRELKSRGLPSS